MADLLFLTAYHVLLFRAFYFQNPYVYARSEALEQGFASWELLGQRLRARGVWGGLTSMADPYYYPDYVALPFLSTYYPPHWLSAWLTAWWPLNSRWRSYSFTMVVHYWLSSWSVYTLFVHMGSARFPALFGAITLSSLAYGLRQNSSIAYTMAWTPVMLLSAAWHSIPMFGISVGMMLLAGYWPVAYPMVVVGCLTWWLGLPSA